MNSDHIPYILYDLSLAIGSEVRLAPLLVKTLQRLLFHTGFPVGIAVLDQAPAPDGIHGHLHAVIGDHTLLRQQGQIVQWPSVLLEGPSELVEDRAGLSRIGGSCEYSCALRLPVGERGTILLLSKITVPAVRMFARILDPILQNLDRSIRLVRDSEQLTRTLESDLARSRSLLQTVIDTAPVMISWKDLNSRYLGCNASFAAAVGLASPLEVIGKEDHELVWTPQAGESPADDRRVIESGAARIGDVECMTGPAGEVAWLRTSKVPLRGTDGEVIGVLGLAEDISARKEVEAALLSSEARYRAAFETTLDSISIHRMDDGTLIDCNRGFLEITGLQREEAIGRRSLDLGIWADPAERQRLVDGLERNDHVRNLEVQLIRRDGSRIWGLVTASCVTMGGVPCVFTVTRDVSDMKAARQELESYHQLLEHRIRERTTELSEAKGAAESANAAKSLFLANMSHEIRTPLSVITGMAHLIRGAGLTSEQTERIDKLLGASRHLLHTLDAILDLSKIETGKMTIESRPLQVESVVSNVLSMMRERAESKGLRLLVHMDPMMADLQGDAGKLQQALLNLVANAVKFTAQGSVLILVRQMEIHPDSVLLCFEVTDTGIGVAPEALPRLFQAFEQADNSIKRTHGGTGLGLAITRKLAGLMGGQTGAASQMDEGSTFWFTARLDRVRIAPNPDHESGNVERMIASLHGGRPVLVVEDDPANREITSLLLTGVGLQVDTANDGIEALHATARRDYALVIMDMQMPNMDGLEATRRLRLRAGGDKVPIVAMTANAFAKDRENCIGAGMNDFITKPITPPDLYRTVLGWLERSPVIEIPADHTR